MQITNCDYKRGIELFMEQKIKLRQMREDLYRELGANYLQSILKEDTLSLSGRRSRIVDEIRTLNWIISKKESYEHKDISDMDIIERAQYITKLDVVAFECFSPTGRKDSEGLFQLNKGDQIKVLSFVKREDPKASKIECYTPSCGLNFITNEIDFHNSFKLA